MALKLLLFIQTNKTYGWPRGFLTKLIAAAAYCQKT